jgi:MFS family permease
MVVSDDLDSLHGHGRPRVIRALIWMASGLFLAILGSALWDFVFKSLFIWLGERLVELTNFGSSALIDSMYREIAKGNYERGGLFAYVFILGIAAMLPLGLVSTRQMVRIFRPSNSQDRNLEHGAERGWRAKPFYVNGLAMLICGAMLIQATRTVYIVRAANQLVQLQTVVAPYISTDQRLMYASRVAQIETKADYIALVDELTAIITERKLTAPSFDLR